MKKQKKKRLGRLLLLPVLLGCVLLLGLIFRLRFSSDEIRLIEPPEETQTIGELPAPTATPCPYSEEELRRWTEDAEALRLSELMTKNTATLQDADGDFSDWVELVNSGDRAVALGDWSLSDKESGKGWRLPELSLEPGERLLIFASGKDRREGELHTDFSLSEGEYLSLRAPDGTAAFTCQIPDAEKDCSLIPADGGFSLCLWPTPGQPNDAEGYEDCQRSQTRAGALLISEVMPNGVDDTLRILQQHDWVELLNVSDTELQLSDYYLSDDRSDYLLFRLPERTLRPGQRFLLVCDKDGCTEYPCAPFSLSGERESLYLSTDGRLCDYVSLHDIPLGGSLGRQEGREGFVYFASATPGEQNGSGARRVSAMPVSTRPGGVFENTDALTVELQAAGTISYTLDGSYPNANSAAYSGPLSITETTVLRAVATEPDALPSRPYTETYFLNEGHSLPVLSLVADDFRAFRTMYDSKDKNLELPGSLSLYEDDGSFSIGCGITMSGATSLELPKKNVSVHFRGAYGASKLCYDLFDGGVDEFESLTIRAGQDYYYAIIRDELAQNLAIQMSPEHVISQRSKYCVFYVNGVYYGVYALKEKINRAFIASWAGVSKDSVTLEAGPVPEWRGFGLEVYSFVDGNDMRKAENYEHFCEIADADSFIDWLILEGYCANPDILLGNVRYAKSSEDDGKWRVVFYDLDSGLRRRFLTFYNLIGTDNRVYIQQISCILRPLLENEDFRARFLERFAAAIYGPLSDENVLAEIERLYGQIESELPRDFKRWSRDSDNFEFEFKHLVKLISEDYAQYNIETVCELLKLTDAERAKYFPTPAP